MDFTCLVLTCNRPQSLAALLDSLVALELPSSAALNLFVWDNGDDLIETERIVQGRSAAFRRHTCLNGSHNVLLRGKYELERAALGAGGDTTDSYVIHLDDDVQLDEFWLTRALSALTANLWDACGSVEEWQGKRVFCGQSKLEIAEELVGGRRMRVWDWRWEPIPRVGVSSPVEFAGHRALLVRAAVAAQVQHDPVLLIGGEDLDYSLTLRAGGFSIGIAHEALIRHRSLGESDAPGFRRYDRVLASWRRFHSKWGFVRRNAASEAGVTEQDWLRLISESVSCQ